MKAKNSRKKVIVAMSGGVDSSVAVALLQREGFSVIGAYFRLAAVNKQAEKRASQSAKVLGISFYVFDLRKEFKKAVVDYFLKEYKAGRTPNPCVVCNKEIKFHFLIKKALELKADYVATGHYARIKKLKTQNSKLKNTTQKFKIGEVKLIKAKDKNKDQSYFLWKLNQKELSKIILPIGKYIKPEVRKMAERFGLPTAKTPESQEVCFIKTNIANFLKKYLKTKPGDIVNLEKKILGQHQGLWFYTIGQRKGIGLPGGPYYVVGKDFKNNELIVSQSSKDLLQKELTAKQVNWLSGLEPELPLKCQAKIRYGSKPAMVLITKKIAKNSYQVVFNKDKLAVTPGQSAVFYKKSELIGGGIIA